MSEQGQDGRKISPLMLTLSMWCVVLLMSLYGAGHVRDELSKNEELSKVDWLNSAATQLMKIADATGVGALEGKLVSTRETINAPYTVLAKPVVEAPPPPPPTPPPPVSDDALATKAPHKRRVLVIGASSIQFAVGVELEKRLPTYNGVSVKRFGQLATGLSRPDFMDWPKKLESLASKFKPDLVITNFGGNDAQSIPIGKYDKIKFGTPQWDARYAERVKAIVQIGKKHGAETVMLGMPVMRKTKFNKKIHRLNRVMKQAVQEEGAMFISTFEMAAKPDGTYRKTIEYRGKRGLMRMSDGVHYTGLGARFLVEQVMQIVERHYVFENPEADRAVAQRHRFTSKILGRDVSYVAYVPRTPREGAPVVVALPQRAWSAWPDHPHRDLQRAAEANGATVVVPELHTTEVLAKELIADVGRHLDGKRLALVAGTDTATNAMAMLAARTDRFASVSFDQLSEVPTFEGSLDGVAVLLGKAAETTQSGFEANGATVEVAPAALGAAIEWHLKRGAPPPGG